MSIGPAPEMTSLIGVLPTRPRVVATRELGEIQMIAVHCDGRDREPGDDPVAVLKGHAQYHIDKDWRNAAQVKAGDPVCPGDGLMYHFAISDDAIYETRDLHEVTWHATQANRQSLAIVLLCGFDQAPTPGQIANLWSLLEWLCHHRPDIPASWRDVWGHGELTQFGNNTPCPGGSLRHWVQQYRAGLIAPADPFPIMGAPTISAAVFAAQLARRNSPALQEHPGEYYFDVIRGYGLDPAILLGMFGKESEFGTYEHSPVNKPAMPDACNWANIRPNPDTAQPPGGRAVGRVDSGKYGLFRAYTCWEDGLRDACEKLLKAPYAGLTLQQAIARWAPAADGNDPGAYAATLLRWASAWRAQVN